MIEIHFCRIDGLLLVVRTK